jgi:hypothetical protein
LEAAVGVFHHEGAVDHVHPAGETELTGDGGGQRDTGFLEGGQIG